MISLIKLIFLALIGLELSYFILSLSGLGRGIFDGVLFLGLVLALRARWLDSSVLIVLSGLLTDLLGDHKFGTGLGFAFLTVVFLEPAFKRYVPEGNFSLEWLALGLAYVLAKTPIAFGDFGLTGLILISAGLSSLAAVVTSFGLKLFFSKNK